MAARTTAAPRRRPLRRRCGLCRQRAAPGRCIRVRSAHLPALLEGAGPARPRSVAAPRTVVTAGTPDEPAEEAPRGAGSGPAGVPHREADDGPGLRLPGLILAPEVVPQIDSGTRHALMV